MLNIQCATAIFGVQSDAIIRTIVGTPKVPVSTLDTVYSTACTVLCTCTYVRSAVARVRQTIARVKARQYSASEESSC